MATASPTLLGKVSAIVGKAYLRLPDGGMRELKVGDVIREGDVVVVADNGRVEITDEAGAVYVPRSGEALTLDGLETAQAADRARAVEPASAADIDRIISAVDAGTNPDEAPAAGLTGDGSSDGFGPGLRVERVSESVTPAALETPADTAGTDLPVTQTSPADQAQQADATGSTGTPTATAPSISSGTGGVQEDLTLAAGGTLTATDADNPGLAFLPQRTAGALGTLSVASDGRWDYQLDNSLAQGLAAGEVRTESFTVALNDGSSTTVTVTVAGTNDGPTVVGGLPGVSGVDGGAVRFDTGAAFTDVDNGDVLAYSADGLPAGLSIDPVTGVISGTLASDASGAGPYAVTVTATDRSGAATSQSFELAVGNVAPVGADASATTVEDQAVAGTVTASDADGDSLSFAKTAEPAHGSVVVNADGRYVYTPNADFHGTDSFTVRVSDGQGGTDTMTVRVTVAPSNDVPVIVGSLGDRTGTDAAPVSIPTAGGFADIDAGDQLTYTATGLPAGLSIDANTGVISGTLSSDASVSGPYRITVTATDSAKATATQTFELAVNNPAPEGTDQAVTATEDQVLTGSVTATDADNDTLVFSKATDPANGTVTVNTNGSYTYTPKADFNGTDSFTVKVDDGQGGVGTLTVKVTVSAGNDAPVIVGNLADSTGTDAAPVSIPTAGGFADIDTGDKLTYTATGLPAGLSIDANTGVISGTLSSDASVAGPYRITVTATDSAKATATQTFELAVNNPAPEGNDQTVSVNEDQVLTGSVTAADADNDTLVFTKASDPANGTVTVNSNGSYTYTPKADFNGADSFTVKVDDGQGGVDTLTVKITVSAGNDAPVIVGNLANSTGTDAAPVSIATAGGFADIDAGDQLTYTATGLPAGLSIDATTGVISGTLSSDASVAGPYRITVTATDSAKATATQTFELAVNNPAPEGTDQTVSVNEDEVLTGTVTATDADNDTLVFSKATDPANGTVTVNSNGSYTYTPKADFNGTDSFTVKVDDGQGGVDTLTVKVTVSAGNDAPVIVGNLADRTGTDAAPVSIATAGGFADIDAGDKLTYTATGLPAGLSIDANTGVISGTLSSDASVAGPYRITVTAADSANATATQTFELAVNNPAPEGADQTATVAEDQVLTGTLTATDADNDTLVFTKATDPANGTVTVNSNGSYTYTPKADFNGTDSFTVKVDDGQGGVDTLTVKVTVSAGNDAPVIVGNLADRTGTDAAPVSIPTAGGFADIDAGDQLTYTATGLPAGLSIDATTGVISGTLSSDASVAGPYRITVTATDSAKATATQTFELAVNNPAPEGADLAVTATEDQVLTGSVTATDADNDTLVFTKATDPANGTVTVNSNGSYTYTPKADFNGNDSFTVKVDDGQGGVDTLTVKVTVSAGNDAPVIVGNLADRTGTDAAPVSIATAGGFADIDAGDQLTYTATGLPAGLSIDANTGVISGTLSSDASVSGPYRITVTATDSAKATASQAFELAVNNPAPEGADQAVTGTEDQVLNGTVTATDADNDTLVFTKASDPANGTVTVNSNGSYTYTPKADFNGTDSFTVKVDDRQGGVDTLTVKVTVSAGNDAPVIVGSLADRTGTDAAPVSIPTAGGFADIDAGDKLTYTATGLPAGLSIDANTGVISGTLSSDASVSGPYRIIVTATDSAKATATQTFELAVNNPAPEGTDQAVTATEDQVLTGSVTATDADNDTLVFTKASDPANGTVTVNSNGSYTYTPKADFNGADSFTVKVDDGQGGVDTLTVKVTVSAGNDAPVIVGNLADRTGTDAAPVSIPTAGGFADIDAGDKLIYTATGLPAGLSIDANTGVISGTLSSDASVSGPYRITVTATDSAKATASQTFELAVNNPAPEGADQAVTGTEDQVLTGSVTAADADNDTLVFTKATDPANGTVTVNSNGSYTYTPKADFNGNDSFTVKVDDGQGGVDTLTVKVTVSAGNDAPVIVGNLANSTGTDAAPVSIPTAGGFADIDAGDQLTYTATGLPAGLSIDANTGVISGNLSSDASVAGPYRITVTATDSAKATASQTFELAVNNPAPEGADQAVTGTEDQVLTGSVTATDADSDTLVFTKATDPANGTVTVNSNGSYTYTPKADFNGTDSFTVKVDDGQGGVDTLTVKVTVSAGNDAPVIVGNLADSTGTDAAPVSIPTAGGFADIDTGDKLTYTATGLPAGLSIDANTGVISGTLSSDASVAGPYRITVTATDSAKATASQTFELAVNNPAPEGADQAVTGTEDQVLTGTLTATDADNDTLMFTKATDPANGTVTVNTNGSYTYTPKADFNGTDSFTVKVDDGQGGVDTLTVKVTVSAGNDAPVIVGNLANSTGTDAAPVSIATAGGFADIDAGDKLTYTATGLPAGLSIDANTGVISGTLSSDASVAGPYRITVTATDSAKATATQTFELAVNNPAPEGTDQTVSVDEDQVLTGTVTATDADNDALVFTKATDPANGTVTVNSNGSYTYTPKADFNGTDSFTVKVDDGQGGADTLTVKVTVSAGNDAPVIVGNLADSTGTDAAPVSIPTAGGFADIDAGDQLTYTATGLPAGLSIDANTGVISGTLLSDASVAGPYRITVTATDSANATATQTFELAVNNPAPEGADQTATVAEDQVLIGTLTATDADNDTLVFTKATDPANGTVTVNSNGSYAYTPKADFNGTDSFTVKVDDGQGGVDTLTVKVTVSAGNDAPVIVGNLADRTGTDAAPVSIATAGGFADIDAGDQLTYTATGLPAGLSIDATTGVISGTLSSDASVSGPYRITVTATDSAKATATQTFELAVNNPAPEGTDQAVTATEDQVLTGSVTATDADNDTLVFSKATDPANGTVTVNSNGSYTYTPKADFNGTDSFTVKVDDGQGGVDTLTVKVTVSAGNDAPVIVGNLADRTGTDAAPLSIATAGGFTDIDAGDQLTYTATGLPAGLSIDANTGVISGTLSSDASVSGPYRITVTATDSAKATATQTFELAVNNPAPEGNDQTVSVNEDQVLTGSVTATDADNDTLVFTKASDPANGTVTVNSNGSYTYTPKADFNGTDSFTVKVDDGQGGVDTLTVKVTVSAGNDAPVIVGNLADRTGTDAAPVSIPTAGGFADIDAGDQLTYTATGLPAGLSIDANTGVISGTLSSDASVSGPYRITVTATDSAKATASQTFELAVNNPAPEGADQAVTGTEDQVLTGSVTATDADSDTLVFTKATDPANGTVTVNSNGSYTYTPKADFNGTDSFTVKVDDGQGGVDTLTVKVTVSAGNDAPVIVGNLADSTSTDAAPVSIATAGGFADIDAGDQLTYTATGLPAGLSIDANTGVISGTLSSDASVAGPYRITVTATDSAKATATQTFELAVNNPAPEGADQTATVAEDQVLTGTLTATDADNDTLVFTKATDPANGTVTVNSNGSYTYTPKADFNGTDSFTVKVDDGQGGVDTLTVKVTVSAGNDAPVIVGNLADSTGTDAAPVSIPTAGGFADIDTGDKLTYTATSLPAGLSIDANTGVISGTLSSDASVAGPYRITVTATDSAKATASQTFELAVNNPAPEGNDQTVSVNEDQVLTGSVTATDADNDTLVFTKASDPANGTVTVNTNGSYTYTPKADFNGTDSFTVKVDDGQGGVDTLTVKVTVSAGNDAPVIVGNLADRTGTDAAPVSIATAGGFADIDAGDQLTYTATGLPAGLSIDANTGVISGTLSSDASVAGPYRITVTATDSAKATATQTFELAVNNPAPEGNDQTVSVNEDQVLTGTVTAKDADNDALVFTKATDPANGAVTVNSNGSYTYTPKADFNGTDSFTVKVDDGQGGVDTLTVKVTVSAGNDAPVIVGNLADRTGTDAAPVSIATAGGFADIDAGDQLTYTATGLPAGLSIDATTGVISGTLSSDASVAGPYRITVTATDSAKATASQTFELAVNNPAPEGNDQTVSVNEDQVLTGSVTATDADNDTLVFTKASDPANGTVTVNSNGSYTYTPKADFNGTDSFTVKVDDGQGGVDTLTVKVTVSAGNDAPVIVGNLADRTGTDAAPVSIPTAGGFADIDTGDKLTYTATGLPAGLSIDANTGVISGTLSSDASVAGPYRITVTATDSAKATASQTFELAVNNPAPEGNDQTVSVNEDQVLTGSVTATDADNDTLVFSKATDPANGTVTVNTNGSYTYTPKADFNGTDSFTVKVDDGQGGVDTLTVKVTVSAGNDAPVIVGNLADRTGTDAAPVSIATAGGFADIDAGDQLTYTATGLPAGLSIDATTGVISGTLSSDASVSGPYRITVTATDSAKATASQTFELAVNNPAPEGTDQTVSVNEDEVLTGTVTATDADNDALVFTKATDPANGTVTVNSNGSYTYTPKTDFNGADSFTVKVDDGQGGVDTLTVKVTVSAGNDAPVIVGNLANSTGTDAAPVSIATAGGFADIDTGDQLTYTATGLPAGLSIDANTGVISGTLSSDASVSGPYRITVTATDSAKATASQTFELAVNNPAPEGNDRTLSVNEDQVLTGTVTAADADNDTLVFTKATDPANGTVTVNKDGSYTYKAKPNFNGTDSFTVKVDDGQGGTDTVTVNVTVNPVNDAPVAIVDGPTALAGLRGEYFAFNGLSSSDVIDSLAEARDYIATRAANATFVATTVNYSGVSGNLGGDNALQTFLGSDAASLNLDPANSRGAILRMSGTVQLEAGTYNLRVLADDGYSIRVDGVVVAEVPNNQSPTTTTHAAFTVSGGAHVVEIIYWDQGGNAVFQPSISSDGGATYRPLGTLPLAHESFTTREDNPLVITPAALLANDTDADGDKLSIISVQAPVNGTVALVNGQVVFTPAANYNGAASFTYTVSDGHGGTATATANITVGAVNDAPVNTLPGAQSFAEDQTRVFSSANGNAITVADVDAGTTLTTTLSVGSGVLTLGATSGVTVSGNGTGSVTLVGSAAAINAALNGTTYTPVADATGTVSLRVTTSDGSTTDTDTVDLTLTPVADITADTANASEDTTITLPVLSNDSFENAGRTITAIDGTAITAGGAAVGVANGSVSLNASGQLIFTPTANYNGSTSFTYTVSSGGNTETATVTVNVAAVNDAPVLDLDADNSSGASGSGYVVAYTEQAPGVAIADIDLGLSDVDHTSLSGATITLGNRQAGDSLALGTLPSGVTGSLSVTSGQVVVTLTGTASLADYQNAIRSITFANDSDTPATTPRTITVTVTDGQTTSNTATTTVNVTAVNDAPVTTDVTASGAEDSTIPVTLSATDVDGTVASFRVSALPANGTLYLDAGMTQVVTANTDLSATNGSLTLYFRPTADWNGNTSFQYAAKDHLGLVDATPNTAAITVTAVNDAPVTANVTASGAEDSTIPVTLTATDADGTVASFRVSALPANGTLYLDAGMTQAVTANTDLSANNGSLTLYFRPTADWNGNTSFQYAAKDHLGLVDATPNTAAITVSAVNDAPVTTDVTASGAEDSTIPVTLTATDVDGTVASFRVSALPANGTLYLDAGMTQAVTANTDLSATNGSLTLYFRPTADWNGNTSFQYAAKDHLGLVDATPNTAAITVTAVNDAPVTANVTASGAEDSTIPVTLTATDADGTVASFRVSALPANGTLYLDAGMTQAATANTDLSATNGSLTLYFRPTADWNGNTSFQYAAKDDLGLVDATPNTAAITVTAVNDAPVTANVTASGAEDTTIPVTLAATDVDGTVASFRVSALPANGTLYLDAGMTQAVTANTDLSATNGSLTLYFRPTADWNGNTSFQYAAKDHLGLVDATPNTASIAVTAVNDAPVATPVAVTGTEDTPLTLTWAQFGVTDVDSAATTLGITITSLPADGTLQMSTNGSTWTAVTVNSVISKAAIDAGHFRFVPDSNESGADAYGGSAAGNRQSDYARFNFTPTDGSAAGSTQTAVINITPMADTPTLTQSSAVNPGTVLVPGGVGTLMRDYFKALPGIGSTSSSSAPDSMETAIENAVPTSSAAVSNAGETGSARITVAVDDAYKVQGLIYLEAGRTYNFTGYADDTVRLEIGGNTLISGRWGGGGQADSGTFSTGAMTVATTGYYSLEFFVYNTSGPGDFDLNVSIDGKAAVDVSTANIPLYGSIGQVGALGGQHGAFVATGEGGYYPVAYNTGMQGSTVRLAPITAALADTDGSETLTVRVSNIPVGVTLSDGSNTFTASGGVTSVNVSGWNLSSLRVTAPSSYSGSFTLTAEATSSEASSASTASSSISIPVTVVASTLPTTLAFSADTMLGKSGDDSFFVSESGTGLSVAITHGATTTVSAISGTDASATTSQVFDTKEGNDYVEAGAGADVIYMGDSDALTTTLSSRQFMTMDESLMLDADGSLSTYALYYSSRSDINEVADVANGGTGNDRIFGQGGTDFIYGGAGDDIIHGGNDNDALRGGAGADVITGGSGNDVLRGDAGADVFRWELADRGTAGSAPTTANDIIKDFNVDPVSNGGDVLDLRDLLSGEVKGAASDASPNGTAGNLTGFIDINISSGQTEILISSTGKFTGTNSATVADQRIVLENVDLRVDMNLSSTATDKQIIEELINRGKLLTD